MPQTFMSEDNFCFTKQFFSLKTIFMGEDNLNDLVQQKIFINRSFAQEYLNRKFNANFEIEEINVSDVVKEMFNVILEWNNYDIRY